jgi:hypothetical protein
MKDKPKDNALVLALGKLRSKPKSMADEEKQPSMESDSEDSMDKETKLDALATAWAEAKTKSGRDGAKALLNAIELAKECRDYVDSDDEDDDSY